MGVNCGWVGPSPVATMCAAFEKRRDYVVDRLKGIEGIKLAAPEGAFYVFPDVSGLVRVVLSFVRSFVRSPRV